ncbi:MAG: YybH family protein [Solirubrobacterales bacterium]
MAATATGTAPVRQASAENAVYSLVATVSDGDAAAAAACFTREGCMITPDGTAVHGRSGIAAILAQMIARRTQIEVEQLVVRPAGDVALATGRLTLHSDGPAGARIEQRCDPTVTLCRVENCWKIAILAPWASNFRVTT